MRNRAKCRLCKEIIESMHDSDDVSCRCGEIEVYGGDGLRCRFGDISNFLRVDDEGNEIKVSEKKEEDISSMVVDREWLIKSLDEMRENVEKMPEHAMLSPITHYDYWSLLILLGQIFRSK